MPDLRRAAELRVLQAHVPVPRDADTGVLECVPGRLNLFSPRLNLGVRVVITPFSNLGPRTLTWGIFGKIGNHYRERFSVFESRDTCAHIYQPLIQWHVSISVVQKDCNKGFRFPSAVTIAIYARSGR